MRKLALADKLTLRFPSRSPDFDEGFEVGMMAALMSLNQTEFTRTIAAGSSEQLASVAQKLGYYLAESTESEQVVRVTFRSRRSKPRLRIVHSAAAAAQRNLYQIEPTAAH